MGAQLAAVVERHRAQLLEKSRAAARTDATAELWGMWAATHEAVGRDEIEGVDAVIEAWGKTGQEFAALAEGDVLLPDAQRQQVVNAFIAAVVLPDCAAAARLLSARLMDQLSAEQAAQYQKRLILEHAARMSPRLKVAQVSLEDSNPNPDANPARAPTQPSPKTGVSRDWP